MHSRCTKDEPCTPCDRDKLILFGASRCGSCSQRFQGDCNFIPDIGPYCYKYPNSKYVVSVNYDHYNKLFIGKLNHVKSVALILNH